MTGQDTAERALRVQRLREQVQQAAGRVVVGLQAVTDQLLMALLAGGHVLLEGVPGTAKTTLCRTFAAALGIHFERIQFTPDLLPSDVTGTQVLDRATSEFVLRRGPIFCQLLLADELNRAPARTQSALLEAMQERQVTIEGRTLPLHSRPAEQTVPVTTPDEILRLRSELDSVYVSRELQEYIVDLAR